MELSGVAAVPLLTATGHVQQSSLNLQRVGITSACHDGIALASCTPKPGRIIRRPTIQCKVTADDSQMLIEVTSTSVSAPAPDSHSQMAALAVAETCKSRHAKQDQP